MDLLDPGHARLSPSTSDIDHLIERPPEIEGPIQRPLRAGTDHPATGPLTEPPTATETATACGDDQDRHRRRNGIALLTGPLQERVREGAAEDCQLLFVD